MLFGPIRHAIPNPANPDAAVTRAIRDRFMYPLMPSMPFAP
jgi:hypothetical protein